MSLADTRLLARRCPACRRREPGLLLSRGTWEGPPRNCRRWGTAARGSAPSGRNREALSTVAGLAFGPVHSSEELSVMEGERRGRTIRSEFVRATREFWEGSSGRAEVAGKAVCDFEAARMGSVPESQGQPGSAGRGRVLDRGFRSRSEE